MAQSNRTSVLIANADGEEVKLATIRLRTVFPGCRVEAVYSVDELREWVSKHDWHAILLDEQLLQSSWLTLIPELKQQAPRAVIMLQTDRNDIALAMQAVRAGVDHCFCKKSPTFLTEFPAVTKALLEERERPAPSGRSSDRYARITEEMSEVVYELDAEGRFVDVSPNVVKLLGYTPEELIGTHFSKVVPVEELPNAVYRLNERRTGERATRNLELRLKTKAVDGQKPDVVEVELTAMGRYNQQHQVQGTVGVMRDIRSRKRALQEREEQLRREFRQREEQLGQEYHNWEMQIEQELKRREEELREEFQRQVEKLTQEHHKLASQVEQEQHLREELQRREEQLRQEYQQREELLRQEQRRLEAQLEEKLQQREEQLRREYQEREEKLKEEQRRLEAQLEEELQRRKEQLCREAQRQGETLVQEQDHLKSHLERVLHQAPERSNSLGTVLIVEPQETVLGLTRTLLQQHGYTVLPTHSASEAMALCKAYKHPIHLLLADVGKPGAVGLEAAEELMHMRQEMKVLYLSGYLTSSNASTKLVNRGIHFLQKPFTPDALIRKIADIVDPTSEIPKVNTEPIRLSALP